MRADYLERSQVSVRPPEYRLFDHILAALTLEAEGGEVTVSGNARVRLFLGTLSHPSIIQTVTGSFLIDDIPRIELARIGWQRLQAHGKTKWSFGHLLFLHLEHNTPGLGLEFPLIDDAITTFQVNLGGLIVSGNLPETFRLSEYFGDAIKLED